MITIGKYTIPESSIAFVDTQFVRVDKDTNHLGIVEDRPVNTVRIYLLTGINVTRTGIDMPFIDINEGTELYEAAKRYFTQGTDVLAAYHAAQQPQEIETKAIKKKATEAPAE